MKSLTYSTNIKDLASALRSLDDLLMSPQRDISEGTFHLMTVLSKPAKKLRHSMVW